MPRCSKLLRYCLLAITKGNLRPHKHRASRRSLRSAIVRACTGRTPRLFRRWSCTTGSRTDDRSPGHMCSSARSSHWARWVRWARTVGLGAGHLHLLRSVVRTSCSNESVAIRSSSEAVCRWAVELQIHLEFIRGSEKIEVCEARDSRRRDKLVERSVFWRGGDCKVAAWIHGWAHVDLEVEGSGEER